MSRSPNPDGVLEYYEDLDPIYNMKWTRGSSHGSNIHLGYYGEEESNRGEAVEKMKKVVADSVDIGPDDRVLDCSGGYGDNATWLAENRGCDVVGLNISKIQIKEAWELANKRNVLDNVEFRFDDFTEMKTIDENSFDVVWGLESICYAEDKTDFLEQAKRVLKDGGRIVVADWYMNKRDLSDEDEQIMQNWLDGWVVPNYAHIDDFIDCLDILSFSNIKCNDATENTMRTTRFLYYHGLWAYPVGTLLSKLGLVSKHFPGNGIACYNMHKAYKRDICMYGIVSAEL